jgi:predicted ester cyclase
MVTTEEPAHSPNSPGTSLSTDINKALVLRYWQEAWNLSDYQVLRDIFADALTIHFHERTVTVTHLDHEALIRQWHAGFPDLSISVEDVVAEGDKVVARCRLTGTHMGEFAGIDATGDRVAMSGIYITRITGGKIAERWDEYDLQGVLAHVRQAGGFPARRTWDGP